MSGPTRLISRGRRVARWVTAFALGLVLLAVVVLGGFRAAAFLRERDVMEARAPAGGTHIVTTKGRLFVQDAGPRDGPVLLLVHGTAAWSEFWRGTIAHFIRLGYRVVAIDLPPFGYSDRAADSRYPRADQARRIGEAMDRLGIRRATFIGHSFGAGATVEAVMRMPERVEALVLVAGALGLPEGSEPVADAPTPLPVRLIRRLPWLAEPVVAATLTNPLLTRRLLESMLYRREAATPELADVLQRPMTLMGSTAELTRWLVDFLAPDPTARSRSPDAYRRIAAPTHLIWGDKDTITPLAQGERLQQLIPGAKLSRMTAVGHIPQIEDPFVFRRILGETLAAWRAERAGVARLTPPRP